MIRLLIILILLCPVTATAVCRVYVVPQIGTGTADDPYRAKYTNGGGIRYGREGIVLIGADTTTAQNNALVAQPDVTKIPDNLDSTIGAALSTVQSKLEAVDIPANWITSTMTYRQALRIIARMLFFFQRLAHNNKIYTKFWSGTVNLDVTFNSLSPANQQYLINAAQSFNLDTTGLSGSSTLRDILTNAAKQMAERPVKVGCATI